MTRKEKRRRLKNYVSGRKSDESWSGNENGKNTKRKERGKGGGRMTKN